MVDSGVNLEDGLLLRCLVTEPGQWGGWAATVGSGPVWDQHPYTAGSKPLNGKAASWRTLLAASMVPFSPEPRHLCYLTLSHIILSLVAKR